MKSFWNLAAPLALLLAASPALAHFVWLSVEKDSSGKPAVHVYFAELAEPDSAELLDRVTSIKVLSRSADGKPATVAVTKQEKDGDGSLVGALPDGSQGLSAQIKYGVITRGENTFLLQYYAKYLDATSANLKAIARDESLPLDVVPHQTDKGITLEVLYQGKPAAGAEVVIREPDAADVNAKTDEAGRLPLTTTKPGLYSIRAKWVVKETGKEGDKEFSQVNHYSTLALRVPAK